MRTHALRSKKPTSQLLHQVKGGAQPRSVGVPPMQAKSNEEGLAEWEEQRQKWARLGSPWMDKVPNPSGELAQPWIQRKLTIGDPNDKYEQEADRVATQVVQQINAPISTQSSQELSVQGKELRAKPNISRREAITKGEVSTDLESAINRARGGGQPLDVSLKQSMEQMIGANFSKVRVHTDAQSDQLNKSIQAKAFTTGHDIFFRQGEYCPGSQEGQVLIAHELTHVMQQNGGRVMRSCEQQVNSFPNSNTTALSGLSMERVLNQKQCHLIQRMGEYENLSSKHRETVDQLSHNEYLAQAEDFERKLGRLASIYPNSISAARAMVENARKLTQKALSEQADAWLPYIFGTTEASRTGSVGQSYEAILDVFETGNFREQMTLVYNAFANWHLAPMISSVLVPELDPNKIFNRPEELSRDRGERNYRDNSKETRTTELPSDVQWPPLSEREQEFSVDNDGLKWVPGLRLIWYDQMSQYAEEARQLMVPVGGGRSGTTHSMLTAAKYLDIDLEDARLACIGWMIPARDHTFYEIMIAAREFGLTYIEGPGGYRLIPPLDEGVLLGLTKEGQFPDYYLTEDYKDQISDLLFEEEEPIFLKRTFEGSTGESLSNHRDSFSSTEGAFTNQSWIQRTAFFHGKPAKREDAKNDNHPDVKDFTRRQGLDFDPTGRGGFYLTEKESIANNWVKQKASRERDESKEKGTLLPWVRPVPVVYAYEVKEEDLKKLSSRTFATKITEDKIEFESDEEKNAWQQFVTLSRQERNSHDFEFVRGPMLDNPTEVATKIRLAAKEKKVEPSEMKVEEISVIAYENAKWIKEADQIAIYGENAAQLFDQGKKSKKVLEWDDPGYISLEIKHSNDESAKEREKECSDMSREDLAFFLYQNRLIAESPTGKKLQQDTRKKVIESLFKNKDVRKVVWEGVASMDKPPGSIKYEYERSLQKPLPGPEYDMKILTTLPGVQQAIEQSDKKTFKDKTTPKPTGSKKKSFEPTSEQINILNRLNKNDGFISLDNSQNDTEVQKAIGMNSKEFMESFKELSKRKWIKGDKDGLHLLDLGWQYVNYNPEK